MERLAVQTSRGASLSLISQIKVGQNPISLIESSFSAGAADQSCAARASEKDAQAAPLSSLEHGQHRASAYPVHAGCDRGRPGRGAIRKSVCTDRGNAYIGGRPHRLIRQVLRRAIAEVAGQCEALGTAQRNAGIGWRDRQRSERGCGDRERRRAHLPGEKRGDRRIARG